MKKSVKKNQSSLYVAQRGLQKLGLKQTLKDIRLQLRQPSAQSHAALIAGVRRG